MNENGQTKMHSFTSIWCMLCAVVTVLLLLFIQVGGGDASAASAPKAMDAAIMDKYDMVMTNRISDALSGILSIEKVYWLSDDDMVAPEPDPSKFGETTDPSSLQWLMEDAAEILNGQTTVFSPDVQIIENSKVKYYLDDSIFAVTWQQGVDLAVFTCTEVRIAHPSQFRRFFAGGEYGSRIRYTTTEMAKSVNAVTASNGDYYNYRDFGFVVNNGVVYREGDGKLDTCFIDDKGDLIFVPKGTLPTREALEAYVAENNIRFSLAFGPILLENGEIQVPGHYPVGEMNKNHSRAALCQLGECHYMIVTANTGKNYYQPPTLPTFARELQALGVQKAYTLDGGQTATIVTGDELMNNVDYGGEREISDIIYFATAIPDGA